MGCAVVLFYRVLDSGNEGRFQINLTDNLFLMALFGFVFAYGLFSFLVTLFNLPYLLSFWTETHRGNNISKS